MPQSILGRITQMARANINAVLDSVEDPKVMLDQMVRDYTSSIKEAETAVASTIGNLRLLEQDTKDARKAMSDWETKARAASGKADELKKQGNTAEADKFDDLARIALSKQIGYESDVANFEPAIKEQTEVVDKLKAGLAQMHGKLEELKAKRNELANRQKVTQARERVQDMKGAMDAMDPTSELGRYEEMVKKAEARVSGKEELSAESIDARFESLVKAARDDEVEKRLAALK
jgi:phage shock protein A